MTLGGLAGLTRAHDLTIASSFGPYGAARTRSASHGTEVAEEVAALSKLRSVGGALRVSSGISGSAPLHPQVAA